MVSYGTLLQIGLGVNRNTRIMHECANLTGKAILFLHCLARKMHIVRLWRPCVFLACCFVLMRTAVLAQSASVPPATQLSASDLFKDFRLPPLKDTPDQPLASEAAEIRMLKRAHTLGITSSSAIGAWSAASALLRDAEKVEQTAASSAEVFTGNRASELNRLLMKPGLSSVRVSSPTLEIDEPLHFIRDGITLDLGAARLHAPAKMPYAIRIENVRDVRVIGGTVESGDSAILIAGGGHITVEGAHVEGLAGDGIVITHSDEAIVRDNRMTQLGGPGIVLHDAAASAVVERNEITRNRGSSNMAAGILITDRNVNLADRAENIFGPDGYWVIAQPMKERLAVPKNNLIAYNRITSNASSGIYVDGAVANVIALNLIEGNAKEGICFDNGATANVLAMNDILENGSRWGESDAVMAKDSIADGGRLPDGTPAAKVPGVSIDNAAYNLVFSNTIAHNFGGGVKIVRTGYFNVIGLNTILSNNDGASTSLHFFGVEMGAAPLDAPSNELDATPSRGNIVFSNTIRGSHYAGVFLGPGSDQNDIFDNVIMDAQHWALESVAPQNNSSLNNLTNLPSRNIAAGLSPSLLVVK